MVRLIALSAAVLLPLLSWGQTLTIPAETLKKDIPAGTEEATPLTPTPKKYDERVEVTGSHIRKIDVEGSSPILTVNRKDIDKTNYNSVSDIMRETTISAFGSTRETSGSGSAGVAEMNLRGLGPANTLVLLNGHRLPADAVTGTVDMNMLPTAAIERMDVLKDGSSAVYGSDALAGVVNMVTRKDFNGNEISVSQTTPEYKGGKRQDISLVNGLSRGRFSMVNVVQYRNNEVVKSRDRSFSNNSFSPTGDPGSYSQGGAPFKPDPRCPSGLREFTPQGEFCGFNTGNYSSELPALQQVSLFHDNTLAVGSRLKFNTRILGTRKTVQWNYAPQPGAIKINPGSRAMNDLKALDPSIDETKQVNARFRTVQLGNRDHDITTTGINLLEDVGIELGRGWAMDVVGSHNIVRTKDNGENGFILRKTLQAALDSGRISPYSATNDYSGLNYVTTHDTESHLSTGELKVSGPVAELPAGDMAVAVGVDVSTASFQDSVDDEQLGGNVWGDGGSNGKGSRDTRSAFSELAIPLTKKLDLSLAARYDHFNDFGDTTNPKVSLSYRATKSLMLRASAGTGFRAPLLQDLYRSKFVDSPWVIDRKKCDEELAKGSAGNLSVCSPFQVDAEIAGNPNLKPERSLAYNAGAVFQPTRDLAIGFDVFKMSIKDVIGLDYDDTLRAEALYGSGFLAKQGVILTRDPSAYGGIDIKAPLLNLARQEISGIDLQSEYRLGQIRLGMTHSQFFYFKQEGFPGMGLRNRLGEQGKPSWRNVASVSYLPSERHDLTLSGNTIAGQHKLVREIGGSTNNYTSLDLEYSYAWRRVGLLSLGVKNLVDSDPPLDDTQPAVPLNRNLYDQIGRMFYTGYKATF